MLTTAANAHAPTSPAPVSFRNSDYRCHPDHQPRTHHKIHEEVSGCWSYNSSSAKRFPHCSTAISSSGGSIPPSCRKHSTGNNSDRGEPTDELEAQEMQRSNTEGIRELARPSHFKEDPLGQATAATPFARLAVHAERLRSRSTRQPSPRTTEAEPSSKISTVTSSEKVGAGAGDVVVFPKNFGDPSDLTSTPKAYATKFFNKLTETEKWELEQDLLNAMVNNAWGKPDAATSEIQEFKKGVGEFFDKLVCKQKEQQALHYELHKNIALQRRVTLGQAENIRALKDKNAELNKQLADAQGASSSLATTSSELENLRSSYQELEIKLKEAEQQKEPAEKQLAEKNSELIREKGEFVLKRNADSETIKRQQKELNGLRKYMETAEHHWDLLAENILEPLGYSERRRNKFPRDDVLSLAGDDCKDLISASRKICHNLSLKKSRTCGLRKLVKRMDILPELVTDLQASSARGAAAMTLTMCLAHNPEMDLDRVTSGVPPTADVGALLDAVSGYDTRIARRIRHDKFYDKVVLPTDESLEDELQKERDAETRLRPPSFGPAPRMLLKRKPSPALQPPKKMKRVMKMCRLRLRAPKEKIQRAMLLRPRRSENFKSCGIKQSIILARGFVI
ncbi:hypothetical protein QYE76_070748 [Lolium multiflorum]|uniref:Uncharacterized protein n=1 Tax=Lolium multiflorum TaxID=4521 RepID=A0AAD8SJY2_LOLMU|nr:hypothetical protein QYE76_070748 [Lolium multiflorum]